MTTINAVNGLGSVPVDTSKPISNGTDFGVADPAIDVMPEYTGIKSVKDPGRMPERYLPYEWSPQVQVEPDSLTDWHKHLANANFKIDDSMKQLKQLFNERVPADPSDMSARLRSGLTSARQAADTFMYHDPKGDPVAFSRNEVPRYQPDGTLHADDAAHAVQGSDGGWSAKAGSRLVFDPPAQAHMETLLYRTPSTDIDKQAWEGIDDAAKKLNSAVSHMDWDADQFGEVHRPQLETAYKDLRTAKRQLNSALREAGAPSADSSPWNRVWNRMAELTPKETLIVGGSVVGAITVSAAAIAAKVAWKDN